MIEDPLRRYLPAKLNPAVIDRGLVLESFEWLEHPTQPEDWRQLVHRLPLRPAPGAGRRAGRSENDPDQLRGLARFRAASLTVLDLGGTER